MTLWLLCSSKKCSSQYFHKPKENDSPQASLWFFILLTATLTSPMSFNLPVYTAMGHFSKSKKCHYSISWLILYTLSLLFNFPSLFLPQYDYMERLDGKEKWSVVESPRERRSIQTVVLNEAVFVQYLDAGAWHLAFYNDGRERETVSFSTNIMGEHL